jgi:hypothetical protein
MYAEIKIIIVLFDDRWLQLKKVIYNSDIELKYLVLSWLVEERWTFESKRTMDLSKTLCSRSIWNDEVWNSLSVHLLCLNLFRFVDDMVLIDRYFRLFWFELIKLNLLLHKDKYWEIKEDHSKTLISKYCTQYRFSFHCGGFLIFYWD